MKVVQVAAEASYYGTLARFGILCLARLGPQVIHLLSAKSSKKRFHVGATVPFSGIYRVFHSIHRVSHEVTLIKNETFPPCNKCGSKVHFELLKEVPAINGEYDFRVRLFRIPHPEAKEEANEETA